MPSDDRQHHPPGADDPSGGAIGDTGPLLHLHEIGWFHILRVFSRIDLPDQVVAELKTHGIDIVAHPSREPQFSTVHIEPVASNAVRSEAGQLHVADLAVVALAQERSFDCTVLTDDLALRRVLEGKGTTVVGSVGVLVRGYATGLLSEPELQVAINALLEHSTLHLSRGFRAYIRQLIVSLPQVSLGSEGKKPGDQHD